MDADFSTTTSDDEQNTTNLSPGDEVMDTDAGDTTRRTDLRTVEPHYSAAEVYAALDCPYPGTDVESDRPRATRIFYNPHGRGRSKATGKRPTEGNDGGTPFSSPTDGLSASPSSSAAAVRRRAGFSGFESDENDARHDHADEREEHRPMTDGGQIRERGVSGLSLGDEVRDRDADDPNTAVVVDLPDEPAYAREIPSLDASVADCNENYAASGSVATVAYAGDLDRALDVWRSADPEALAELCDDESVRTYDFPTERLREVDS